ncbi:MAG: ABC transporter ATP-binding protein/permease [Deltaproteobacteria bacterium]|nr:ABC transporter ATP-binding protein/permease [Deltaproteobacteria bacterium]MCL5892241.1 ABC transporter ATP-binding protein/permease [Deltaproteobacteria bacterium]
MKKDFNILKRLVPYILPYKKRLILAMISMAIVSVLTGLLAYVVKPLINNIFITKSYEDLLLIPILVMAIFVVKNIFYYAEFYYIGNVGQNIIRTLRDEVYSAIVKFPVPKLNKIPTGVLIARITYDINIIQRTVSDSVSAVMKDILTILVLIVVVFYMDFYLAVVVFVLFPVVIIPVTLLGKKARKTSTDTQTEMGNITKFLDETISSLRTVKAYNMEELEISRFKKLSDNLYRFLMRMTKIRGLTVPFVELIGGVSVSLIIFVGGLQVIKFGYTPGNFFSFLTAILLLYEPVKSLSRLNNSLQEGIAAGTRIFEIIDGESEKMGAHQRSLPEEISSLEIRNLYFSYDKSKGYDLKNINIKALKGKTIAIVGYSGAGKSTISMLIPRFYDPDSGEILINGINTREFNLKDLRNSISYVSQQVILFNESIRFNIAYGSFSKDMKDIIKASEFAFAHDFIMKLPNGYDTIVDEAGLRLSGGEKQRILIARAFLKNAPIIVLDEATSSLDSESEKEIQGALFGTDENPYGLCQNKIAIIIAHRLSTVKRADTIYVLDNGEIVESGNHEELILVNGIYKNLLIKQMGN